ncbi:MAG TPA: hypothetical protein VJ729_06505 [Nitrososphaeraceae archaeon]|nr:hypothetical protein [Nitrososphaeraceae archaeon]
MTSKKGACLSVISMSIVFAATIVTITGFWGFRVAHGQGSNSTSSSLSSLTPQQKAAICGPSNPKLKFVNSTESKLCGIPKTVKSNMSNTTTSPSSAPSVVPTPPSSGS